MSDDTNIIAIMSNHSISNTDDELIMSSSSAYPLSRFVSFEQFNQSLYENDEIDLDQYLQVTKHIQYDHEIIRSAPQLDAHADWIHRIIEYLIGVSPYDARGFRIKVDSLDIIGVDILQYKTKMPKWLQSFTDNHDNNLKREERFLKKSKMVKNVDYDEVISDIDGEPIHTGYGISRGALYRLISNRYGNRFLEAMLIRMGQLLYYFNEYKLNYRSKYIIALQRTIGGLTDDIKDLNNNGYKHLVPARRPTNEIFMEAHSYDNNFSPIYSDAVLDGKEYVDEISQIHRTIETSINRVDGRISDIHLKLEDITTKIDDIVGSIIMTEGRTSSQSPPRSRSFDGTSERREASIDEFNINPVTEHVRAIFNEYEQMAASSMSIRAVASNKPRLRNTCIGSEHCL